MALRTLLKHIICSIMKLHISMILSFLLLTQYEFVNFWMVIVINITLCLFSDTIYEIVSNYDHFFSDVVDYFIKNYSEDSYIKWKRYVMLFICSYLMTVLFLVNVDNHVLMSIIAQNVITSLFYEVLFERRIMYKYMNKKYRNYKYNQAPRLKQFSQVEIDNNFHQINDEKKIVSPPIEVEQHEENKNFFVDFNFLKEE